MPFSMYDQWKTASPYDEDMEFDLECPECKSEFCEDTETLPDGYGMYCGDCGHEFEVYFKEDDLTTYYRKRS